MQTSINERITYEPPVCFRISLDAKLIICTSSDNESYYLDEPYNDNFI